MARNPAYELHNATTAKWPTNPECYVCPVKAKPAQVVPRNPELGWFLRALDHGCGDGQGWWIR